MASTLSRRDRENKEKHVEYRFFIIRCYKSIMSWIKQPHASLHVEMETVQVQGEAEEQDTITRDLLIEQGFSSEEIVLLFKLRQYYQGGGSDRAPLVRHLNFIKYLMDQNLTGS